MSSRFTPSPSKGYNTRSSRSTSSRRPRFLSRSICVLLLIAIFFWTQSSQPEAHVYSPDGLLHVNSEGKHPILELIERSESQWKRKLERQSKTLKQAVDVYKRRYKRAPPKGFDIWQVCTLRSSVLAHSIQVGVCHISRRPARRRIRLDPCSPPAILGCRPLRPARNSGRLGVPP